MNDATALTILVVLYLLGLAGSVSLAVYVRHI
jgi:hypothetical protein